MPAHAENADAALVDKEWRAMTDVHQFFSLLKRHNLSRQQAFRLVGDDLACKVENTALAQLLETARQDGNEIMVFVGNRGCVQIFTGAVEKLVPMKGWLNIFNPTFTLHLLEETIAETGSRANRPLTAMSPAWSCLPPTARKSPSCTVSVRKANRSRASGAARLMP
jgi:putative hemin transport protein